MKIRKNDKVMVMTGKDKGKTGLVIATFPSKHKVLVEGVNKFKKNQKGEANTKGQIVEITKPMDVSKVMIIDPTTDKPTKVGIKIIDGKKVRYAKKSGEILINIKEVKEVKKEDEVKQKPKKAKSRKTKSEK